MLFPELEERLRRARLALAGAASENIIELCGQYLALLAEYRAELYKLPDRLGTNQWSGPRLWEDVGSARKVIRAAIEQTTRERHETEALILFFTSLSGHEAVDTFNRQKYQGHDDWELRAGGVARFCGGVARARMAVLDAVEAASLLRREEHIAGRAPATGRLTTSQDLSPAEPFDAPEGSAR